MQDFLHELPHIMVCVVCGDVYILLKKQQQICEHFQNDQCFKEGANKVNYFGEILCVLIRNT